MLIKNPRKARRPGDYDYIYVPCGKCEACVTNKISNWYVRLKSHLKYADYCCFVTLTYADEHLPQGFNVSKKDVQAYHYRLRKRLGPQASKEVKYYLVSEYGPAGGRPHYHCIYFGLRPSQWSDVTLAWSKGFTRIEPVTDRRLKYCCGYVTEKNFVPEGRDPVFTLMSKGLGKGYITEYKDWHDRLDRMYVPMDGKKMPMPRYFKERFYTSGQRQVWSEQCEDRAKREYDDLVVKLGSVEAVEQRLYDVRANYARKMADRRKKRKTF